MTQNPKEPFNESHLNSVEYRERLMRKLNCLIAVLEVANAKVKRSLTGPDPDLERLQKIQKNLMSTLEVCRRARKALENRESLPEGLPENLAAVVRNTKDGKSMVRKSNPRLPDGARVEMSNPAEHARFEKMGKISETEISKCDLDELTNKFWA